MRVFICFIKGNVQEPGFITFKIIKGIMVCKRIIAYRSPRDGNLEHEFIEYFCFLTAIGFFKPFHPGINREAGPLFINNIIKHIPGTKSRYFSTKTRLVMDVFQHGDIGIIFTGIAVACGIHITHQYFTVPGIRKPIGIF